MTSVHANSGLATGSTHSEGAAGFVTLFTNAFDKSAGEWIGGTWDGLADQIQIACDVPENGGCVADNGDKRTLPAMLPARTTGPRRKGTEYVSVMSACVVLDVDDLPALELDRVLGVLGDYDAIVYASSSDQGEGAPLRRVRIMVRLEHEYDPALAGAVRLGLARMLAIDPSVYGVRQCLEAERLFFVGTVDGTPRQTWAFDGAALDPETLADMAPAGSVSTSARTAGNVPESPSGDPAIVGPLLDELAAVIGPTWEAERQSYALPLFGFLLGKGRLSRDELEQLAERLNEVNPENADKYAGDGSIAERAVPMSGVAPVVRDALGKDALAVVDAILDRHPNARQNHLKDTLALREARLTKQAEHARAANDSALLVATRPDLPHGTESLWNLWGLTLKRTDRGSDPAQARYVPRATPANIANVLTVSDYWAGRIQYDEFGHRVLVRDPPMREEDRPPGDASGEWTDAHTHRLVTWLDRFVGIEAGVETVNAAVTIAAHRNAFHPVRLYLEGLIWDGTPRVDELFERYFGATAQPAHYLRAVSAAFMIGAVARVLKPGCKVDTMPILEGAQGIRKSTGLRVLAGDAWFTDSEIDLHSKDGPQVLQGIWIAEWAELHTLRRAEAAAVKAFVSKQDDRFRPSYGRRAEAYPRQCVFTGSMNPDGAGYFQDTTGNRRFWPVVCGAAVDTEALARDRDQLWAEALHRYRAGEQWHLDRATEALAKVEQAEREAGADDPWIPAVVDWLALPANDPGQPPGPFHGRRRPAVITTTAALQGAVGMPLERQDRRAETRMGQVLKRCGLNRVRRMIGGARGYVYEPASAEPSE